MTDTDKLESHLSRLGVPYEQVGHGTWVLHPNNARDAQIGVKVEDPIVLFSAPVIDLRPETRDRESLFRKLLELNSELLHSCYALEGERVVLSGAAQLQTLDFEEFQAMIDDMAMALDEHHERLTSMAADVSTDVERGDA